MLEIAAILDGEKIDQLFKSDLSYSVRDLRSDFYRGHKTLEKLRYFTLEHLS